MEVIRPEPVFLSLGRNVGEGKIGLMNREVTAVSINQFCDDGGIFGKAFIDPSILRIGRLCYALGQVFNTDDHASSHNPS
jgi:hypothetical protein